MNIQQRMRDNLDRRLRRDLLTLLRAGLTATPDGYVSGTSLYDLIGPGSPPINQANDAHHVLMLLMLLEVSDLVKRQDARQMRDEVWTLDTSRWRIPEKGARLLGGVIPPTPDVWDERLPRA